MNDTLLIKSKADFKQYINPEDLIKIAIFDLWVDNNDRGKSGNFNLLVSTKLGKTAYYAFDNAFAFGGVNGLRIFNPSFEVSTVDKLLNTDYFRSVIKFIPIPDRVNIVRKKLSLCHDEAVSDIITKTPTLIPGAWNTLPGLYPRMHDFLSNVSRLQKIEQLVLSSLSKI